MSVKKTMLYAIRFYQKWISIALPARCRFYPTCSTYTMQSIEKYGIKGGLILSLKRIVKCHPFHPGGFDPVP